MNKVEQITYQCPACQSKIDIATPLVGKIVECPKCSIPFRAEEPLAKPILQSDAAGAKSQYSIDKPSDDETLLKEIHPAMLRRHPIQFVVLVVVGLVAIGFGVSAITRQDWTIALTCLCAIIAIAGYWGYWWLEVVATTLRITNKRTTLRHGIISKQTSEVQHDDVRNLQVNQNAFERILGIGDLAISSSGQDDLEVYVKGIPDPKDAADLVRRMQ